MCRSDADSGIETVKLTRCPHGTFHLNLGTMSLHLTVRELMLLGQTINRWVQAHPETLTHLDEDDWEQLQGRIRIM